MMIIVENRNGFARTVVSFETEDLVILIFELAFTLRDDLVILE